MHRVRALALILAGIVLAGCEQPIPIIPPLMSTPHKESSNGLPPFSEEVYVKKPLRTYKIPTPEPGKPPVQTVIGETGT